MSANLSQKVLTLIDDTESLDRLAKARVVERFVRNECGLTEETKFLDFNDLALIASRAGGILAQEPVHSALSVESRERGGEYMRIACMVQATVEFLRGKGFLSNWIGFRKTHKAQESFEYCRHSKLEHQPLSMDVVCRDCKQPVIPLCYVVKSHAFK